MTPLRRLSVRAGGSRSALFLGSGALDRAAELLVSPSGRFFLVAPRSVASAADRLRRVIGDRVFGEFLLDDHEQGKTLDTVARIADAALAAGLRRDDAVVAVGGGVTSDVAGFAAAMLLRGVAWNAIPTTTGAMADAAIGGKTGVDHPRGKNLLGAFHSPRAIIVDPSVLETLPDREYRSGLVEAFKAAWVADAGLAARSERRIAAVLARRERDVLALLSGAIRVKARIVGSDPRDAGARKLLNFGHTLGHAFEAAGGLSALRHGEAVAWGIAAALEISGRRAALSSEDGERIRSVLARLGPFPEPERSPGVLLPYLRSDKKATASGLTGILLERIGRARIEPEVAEEEWLQAAAQARL